MIECGKINNIKKSRLNYKRDEIENNLYIQKINSN